jgi:hypothetical protein
MRGEGVYLGGVGRCVVGDCDGGKWNVRMVEMMFVKLREVKGS